VSDLEWVTICRESAIKRNDVMRFDRGEHTYAVVRTSEGICSVIDGVCTHAKAHLAEGFVDGKIIECPKHNGRFDCLTGEAVATPALVAVRVYETRVEDEMIQARLFS